MRMPSLRLSLNALRRRAFRRRAAPFLAVLFLGIAGPFAVRAELSIDITKGTTRPLPVAVSDLVGTTPADSALGKQIGEVIAANLERSGLFAPLDPRTFIQKPQDAWERPNFADWRLAGADALVTGSTTSLPDGRLRVEFRLFDATAKSNNQMTGLSYTTSPDGWRRLAHIISDAIYKRITGEDGYFDTRVVYIAESGPANLRVKRLAIMDQDGQNHRFLTDGRVLVLTPRFAPTTQEITYLSYFNNKPRVYLFNIDTGRQELLGDFPGMTFAPRFSPDGNTVIMSLATNGNTDIYTLDLRTRRQVRITDSPSIDTSPSFSPDGQKITFESDRSGTQQIYVANVDGSEAKRITFGDGRYGTPVWSPRGDLIAFTRLYQGRFSIGVVQPDGAREKILTESFHAEGPTWSPNGRVLMYFKERPMGEGGRQRQARIHSIDLTGQNERPVITPTDGSDPAWSPLIP